LRLRANPPPHSVAAHQYDESAARLHRLLQPVEPQNAGADRLVVLEHAEAVPCELSAQIVGRLGVVAAIAQEDVILVRHRTAPEAVPVRRRILAGNYAKGHFNSQAVKRRNMQ
jgi:hypothetical protein